MYLLALLGQDAELSGSVVDLDESHEGCIACFVARAVTADHREVEGFVALGCGCDIANFDIVVCGYCSEGEAGIFADNLAYRLWRLCRSEAECSKGQ